MIRQIDDRRWKTLDISPRQILDLFLAPTYEIYCVTTYSDFPENFEIDEIKYIEFGQAFRFLIYSLDFDLVPEFEMPPRMQGEFRTIFLEKQK